MNCPVKPCDISGKNYIFISYSHADSKLVFRLIEAINRAGYNIWYDGGISISENWTDEVAGAIESSAAFVVFLTKKSAVSKFVHEEILFALNKNIRVIPVYVDEKLDLPSGIVMRMQVIQGIMESKPERILERLIETFENHSVPKAGVINADFEASQKKRNLFAPLIIGSAALAAVFIIAFLFITDWGAEKERQPEDTPEITTTAPPTQSVGTDSGGTPPEITTTTPEITTTTPPTQSVGTDSGGTPPEITTTTPKITITTPEITTTTPLPPIVEDNLSDFTIENGVLKAYKGAGGSVKIPDTVHTIAEDAFALNESITEVIIPDSVEKIGVDAFYGCTALKKAVLPDKLKSENVGRSAFSRCSALKEINIPSAFTEIPSDMFSGCTSLAEIILPKNLVSIGWSAFEDCTSLKNIDFPEKITSIGDKAFKNTGLTEITLPAGSSTEQTFKEYITNNPNSGIIITAR